MCATLSNEFKRRNPTTVLMAKSPRKHTLCTPLSIDQWYIFGIFEHKWGTRKHIDDLKKYTWCIPVQKKIKSLIPGPQERQSREIGNSGNLKNDHSRMVEIIVIRNYALLDPMSGHQLNILWQNGVSDLYIFDHQRVNMFLGSILERFIPQSNRIYIHLESRAKIIFKNAFCCWYWNISGEKGQCCNCWCPRSSHHQLISRHGTD